MNFTEIVKKYQEYGLACLPTVFSTKAPTYGTMWKEDIPIEKFIDCDSIAVKCGDFSGGLECLDFDNKLKDAKEILTKYLEIPEVKEIYEKHKLPIESTQSGGYHLLYRCTKNEGNRKLAQRYVPEQKTTKDLIETRGINGFFLCDPSPKYKLIRNNFSYIATISVIERATLIDNAISMNEFVEPEKNEYQGGTDRPGDLYNVSMEAISDMKSLLQGAGWKDLGKTRWRRPNKNEGISATLGKVAPNILYVFTSNGYPFEPSKAYTPFQVLGLLKFGGDFKEACKSIAPEKTTSYQAGKLQVSELEKILNGAFIDTRRHIDKPPTILSIVERAGTMTIVKRVLTLGNFSCIIGKAKSRKTFLLSVVTAALLKTGNGKVIGEMPASKNEILYFDTEQGEYDSYNVIRRIENMAGTGLRLKSYNLRPFSPLERCQIIEYAFKLFGEKTGFCVIDGIADLANAINDEVEATRVTGILLNLTKHTIVTYHVYFIKIKMTILQQGILVVLL